jgi:NADH dehydrogenase (ubiquinone) 1 alpha subcomplex subunit 8
MIVKITTMAEERAIKLPIADNTSLKCAARIFGYECADRNLDFLRCKEKDEHPSACLAQGEKVTSCVLKV